MAADPLDTLGTLDPDDPRQASQQIADRLRNAILDKRIGPGERLPSHTELVTRYGVSRETVKRALEQLRTERLIVSRQGAGVYVRTQMARPVELRPLIEAAFREGDVSIDFAGLSAETLRDALTEVLDKVRAGDLAPRSLRIRVLVAETSQPMAIPVLAKDRADDPALRDRLSRIIQRSTSSLVDQVEELAELGFLEEATVEVRAIRSTPMTKLYLVNGESCFFGFYPIAPRPLRLKGETVEILDTLGKDVPLLLFNRTDDNGDPGSQFVQASSQWFDSAWETIAATVTQ